ncbi:S41 family peptidase [Spongisporangium articulatum]|uniref:S41 family peptidase n=1 Tax=Spongisporangium articulatum TaxID=3362603 RepID=A0ABW8AHU3_9ACTN
MTAHLPAPLRLRPDQRRDLVLATQKLLTDAYCHLPQKRARYGADPVVRLQRMLDSGDHTRRGPAAERLFVDEYLTVLHGLRDLHTGLTFTDPRRRERVAALPVYIERYGAGTRASYVITKTSGAFRDERRVARGMRVTHWNGVPIEVAVTRLAGRTRGANPAAALARALEHLTIRPLDEYLEPDEDWVTLTLDEAGDVRMEWQYLGAAALRPSRDQERAVASTALGLDHDGLANQTAKQVMFSTNTQPAGSFLKAQTRTVLRRRVGYLRIYSFLPPNLATALDEVVAALRGFADDGCTGLVVDVRNNPGGSIALAENVLGLLVPDVRRVRFSLAATPLTRALADASADLEGWRVSLASAATTGDGFSAALPITAAVEAVPVTDLPAVLITDATTYSAGDIFAAGWADNGVGPIVGAADTTGAGGANVWTVTQLLARLPEGTTDFPLPPGLDLRFAVRRALRAGPSEGLPIEDLGIAPQVVHVMQRDDVLGANEPLVRAAVRLLPRA